MRKRLKMMKRRNIMKRKMKKTRRKQVKIQVMMRTDMKLRKKYNAMEEL